MNSVLEKTITDEDGTANKTEVKESAGSNPLMMAFYRNTVREIGSSMGTIFHYDNKGLEVGTFDLIPGGKTGLVETFLKKIDSVYRDSFHKITVTLNLPEKEIIGFRMDQYIGINNQPLLPELLEYTVKEKDIDVNKVVFRTIRLYKDN